MAVLPRSKVVPACANCGREVARKRVAQAGGRIDTILACTVTRKCPWLKPAGGMLREALRRYGARAAATPYVGDQVDDLKAAFHAGCRRILVRSGLGAKALDEGLAQYLEPVAVFDDLAQAVDAELRATKQER